MILNMSEMRTVKRMFHIETNQNIIGVKYLSLHRGYVQKTVEPIATAAYP